MATTQTSHLNARLLGWFVIAFVAVLLAIGLASAVEEWGTWDGPQGQLITTQEAR